MNDAYTEARDEILDGLATELFFTNHTREENIAIAAKAIDDLIRKHVIGEDMNIPDEMEKVGRDFGALNAIMNIGTAQNNFRAEQRKIVGGE